MDNEKESKAARNTLNKYHALESSNSQCSKQCRTFRTNARNKAAVELILFGTTSYARLTSARPPSEMHSVFLAFLETSTYDMVREYKTRVWRLEYMT